MLGFGDASAICGVYGTYVDPMSGEVTTFNGGCTDPTTASQLSTVASTTTTTTTSFDLSSWWSGLSSTEQLMIIGGVAIILYMLMGEGSHKRGRY